MIDQLQKLEALLLIKGETDIVKHMNGKLPSWLKQLGNP